MKAKTFFIILIILFIGVVVGNFWLLRTPYLDWKKTAVGSLAKKYCDLRGGKMINTGCGIAGCAYNCAIVYSDHGRWCQSQEACKGSCVVVSPVLPSIGFLSWSQGGVPESLKGCQKDKENVFTCPGLVIQSVCSDFPVSNCGGEWINLGNNKIKYQMGKNCSL